MQHKHRFIHSAQAYHFIDNAIEDNQPSEARLLLGCRVGTKSQVLFLCFHVTVEWIIHISKSFYKLFY